MTKAFNDLQRRVLGALTTGSCYSAKEIASFCCVKERAVRNIMDRFKKQGLVTEIHQVNFGKLGLQTFNLYFELSRSKAPKALKLLETDPRVVWLAENVDTYRYEATVVARNPAEILRLCTKLSEDSGVTVVNPHWSIELELYYFGHRFLTPHLPRTTMLMNIACSEVSHDSLDIAILDAFDELGGELTVARLARHLCLPHTTLKYRIKRLTESQVVSPAFGALNTPLLGFAECQILISFAELRSTLHNDMLKFCDAHPHVYKLVRAFGSWSYKLLVSGEKLEPLVSTREELEERFATQISSVQFLTRRRTLRPTVTLAKHPELIEKLGRIENA